MLRPVGVESTRAPRVVQSIVERRGSRARSVEYRVRDVDVAATVRGHTSYIVEGSRSVPRCTPRSAEHTAPATHGVHRATAVGGDEGRHTVVLDQDLWRASVWTGARGHERRRKPGRGF